MQTTSLIYHGMQQLQLASQDKLTTARAAAPSALQQERQAQLKVCKQLCRQLYASSACRSNQLAKDKRRMHTKCVPNPLPQQSAQELHTNLAACPHDAIRRHANHSVETAACAT